MESQTELLNDIPALGTVALTVAGDGARVLAQSDGDPCLYGRESAVVRFRVGDRPVLGLLRVSHGLNGLFLDLLMGESVEDLAAQAGNLSLEGISHSNGRADARDQLALAAAGEAQ